MLEGASTTRRVAKEMLATGRQPRDRDERMIANNLQAIIHPVVRAVILHFWLAYDHPFADGNGRTARALKVDETKEIERLLHGSPELNHRQIAVVGQALRDPSQSFTIAVARRGLRLGYLLTDTLFGVF